MKKICLIIEESIFTRLIVITVLMDMVFGLAAAVRQRKLNNSIGVDGIIRKISMLISIFFISVIDIMVHINLIGFVPDSILKFLPANIHELGLAEFFAILYLMYEVVSILENMALCGLPVKSIRSAVEKFLKKYSNELPETAATPETAGTAEIGKDVTINKEDK